MLRKLLNALSRRAADRLIEAGNRAESEGKATEALERYRQALSVLPGYSRAHLNVGVALEAMGEGDAAVEAYRSALVSERGNPFASYNLGKLLHTRGEHPEAARLLRAALQRKPDFTDARVVLASALEAAGETETAAAELALVLKERPDDIGARYNYAQALKKLGRSAEAETALRRVLETEPNEPAMFQLSKLLRARGAFDEGEALLRRILERNPDWGAIWVVYAELLKTLQRLPDCEAALRRALALDRRLSGAYRLLGGILVDQGRIDEALEVYAAGREFDVEGYVDACELFTLNFHDGTSTEELFARHKAFGERFEGSHPPRFLRHANRPDPERPLRIGYISGEFRAHPVGWGFLPLLEHHDRAAFEVYCYSIYEAEAEAEDEVTRRIAGRADRWRNLPMVPTEEVADIIHRDAIDVLVDLSGYGGIPTFDIMAHRPAPVQASWLGYLSTSGLTRIAYRITDNYADPPGVAEPFHTEKLLRLPHSQWCYRAVSAVAPPAPPCLENGFVTFGAFNQSAKISPTARALWAEILKRAPGSKLVIVGVPPGPATQLVLDDFTRHGVAPGRVTVEARLALDDYFRRIGSVDLALDTTPYSGGTTTCDIVWMGTPVLTLPGTRSVSRSATSILSVLGLRDWIAASPEEYIARGVAFAADPGQLAGLRRSLRERMRASPLMDEPRFARDMEALYRQMWRTWCRAPR